MLLVRSPPNLAGKRPSTGIRTRKETLGWAAQPACAAPLSPCGTRCGAASAVALILGGGLATGALIVGVTHTATKHLIRAGHDHDRDATTPGTSTPASTTTSTPSRLERAPSNNATDTSTADEAPGRIRRCTPGATGHERGTT